ALGRLADAENVTAFSFRRLTVVPLRLWSQTRAGAGTEPVFMKKQGRKHRIKVAIDGEVGWLHTPLVFGVSSKRLLLIKHRSPSRSEENTDDLRTDWSTQSLNSDML